MFANKLMRFVVLFSAAALILAACNTPTTAPTLTKALAAATSAPCPTATCPLCPTCPTCPACPTSTPDPSKDQAIEDLSQEVQKQASMILASHAVSQIDSASPERATLLALEALQEYPYTTQAESALGRAVQETAPFHEWEDDGNVVSLAYSPDGLWLAAATNAMPAGQIQIWDTAQGKLVRSWAVEKSDIANCWSHGLVWSPDSTRLALSISCYMAENASAEVYEAKTGKTLFSVPFSEGVDWSADGLRLLTFSIHEPVVRLWDAQTGEQLDELPGYFGAYSGSFAPDSERAAIGYTDGSVAIWDLQNGAVVGQSGAQGLIGVPLTGTQASPALAAELEFGPERILGLNWSPDGSRLAAGHGNGLVRVWQAAPDGAGYHLAFVLNGFPAGVEMLEWSPDGLYLAMGNLTQGIRLYSAGGILVLEISTPITDLEFSADSRYLVASNNIAIRFWDLSFLPPQVPTHLMSSTDDTWKWSPDGRYLATSTGVQVVGQDTGQVWPAQLSWGLAWSPDSTRIAGQTMSTGQVLVLDVNTGQAVAELDPSVKGTTPFFFGIDWSPDGRRVVSNLSDFVNATTTLIIWDPATGEVLARSPGMPCYMVHPDFSPDSTMLASGCAFTAIQGTTYIFDSVTGAVLHELQSSESWILGAVWSPDGGYLATQHMDGMVSIWDTASWEVVQTLSGHQSGVSDVAWSPDSQRLLSADETGQVYIWDLATAQAVQSYRLNGAINGVDWSPDGQWVALSGTNTHAFRRAWPTTAALIAFAEENFVWRELTAEERQTFGLP